MDIVCRRNISINTLHNRDDDDDDNNNRADIIIKNKKEKTCTLIDVAISAANNVVQKEPQKRLKYKNLHSLCSCSVHVDNSKFFICPTNANNSYKIVKMLKSFKIIIVAPTCFGLRKPSSGSSEPVLRQSYSVDIGYISLFEVIGSTVAAYFVQCCYVCGSCIVLRAP